jgi:hypothetical protein
MVRISKGFRQEALGGHGVALVLVIDNDRNLQSKVHRGRQSRLGKTECGHRFR